MHQDPEFCCAMGARRAQHQDWKCWICAGSALPVLVGQPFPPSAPRAEPGFGKVGLRKTSAAHASKAKPPPLCTAQPGRSPHEGACLALNPGQVAGLVVPPAHRAGALAAGVEGDGDVLRQRQLRHLSHPIACPVRSVSVMQSCGVRGPWPMTAGQHRAAGVLGCQVG